MRISKLEVKLFVLVDGDCIAMNISKCLTPEQGRTTAKFMEQV